MNKSTAARRIRFIIDEYDNASHDTRHITADGFHIQKDYAPYVCFNLIRKLIHTELWKEMEKDNENSS